MRVLWGFVALVVIVAMADTSAEQDLGPAPTIASVQSAAETMANAAAVKPAAAKPAVKPAAAKVVVKPAAAKVVVKPAAAKVTIMPLIRLRADGCCCFAKVVKGFMSDKASKKAGQNMAKKKMAKVENKVGVQMKVCLLHTASHSKLCHTYAWTRSGRGGVNKTNKATATHVRPRGPGSNFVQHRRAGRDGNSHHAGACGFVCFIHAITTASCTLRNKNLYARDRISIS